MDLRLIYAEIHFKNWQDDDRYVTADAILKTPLHGVCHLISVKSDNNLVPRSHSVTRNVISGKVRQYTIFHWPLKKGCGNATYAPIGLFLWARNEGLVFASSCAEESFVFSDAGKALQ